VSPEENVAIMVFGSEWILQYGCFKFRSDSWYTKDDDQVKALRLWTHSERTCIVQRLKRGYGHGSIGVMLAQQIDDRQAVSAAWRPLAASEQRALREFPGQDGGP
jgi:hypothetical protein